MNINVAPEKPQSAANAPFRIERLGAKSRRRDSRSRSQGADCREHFQGLRSRPGRAQSAGAAGSASDHRAARAHQPHVRRSRSPSDAAAGRVSEILVLDNHKDNPVLSTDVWHSDTTFRKNPTKYTILRCEIMPELGGDTLWANMEAAYEGLSEIFRGMIAGLRAVHDFQNFRVLFKNTAEDRAKLHRMEDMFPKSVASRGAHPSSYGTKKHLRQSAVYAAHRGHGAGGKPRHPRRSVRAGAGAGISVSAALGAGHNRILGQPVDQALRRQRLLSGAPAHGAHRRRRRRAVLSSRALPPAPGVVGFVPVCLEAANCDQ